MSATPQHHEATPNRLGHLSQSSIETLRAILSKKATGEDEVNTSIQTAIATLRELDPGTALDAIIQTLQQQHTLAQPRPKDQTAYGIFTEFEENLRANHEMWEAMAGIRRAVYSLGLAGGPDEINEKAHREARKNGETNPEHEEILIWRTIIALKTLATIEGRKRDEILGLARAKYTRQNLTKTAEKYFDTGNQTLKADINSESPIDELVGLVEIAETSASDDPLRTLHEIAREAALEQLIRKLITQDRHQIMLGMKFLKLRHIRAVIDQMPDSLSSGRIGAKSFGIILAYAALEDGATDELQKALRQNTSRFIGSQVFASVLAHNESLGRTSMLKPYYRRGDAPPNNMHEDIRTAMMAAEFPRHIERQLLILFRELHGQPIIVRSSSELEDRLGASFAGQYDSVELANCRNFATDFEAFKNAIRTVYASVFNPNVMRYRKLHGLLGEDEEMGILVQVLNGQKHGDYFYPTFSAMATSFAPQVIGADISPDDGSMALAVGLGRAVVDGTGSKFVMLGKPRARGFKGEIPQTKIHVLQLSSNTVVETTREELGTNLAQSATTYGLSGQYGDRWRSVTCNGAVSYTNLPELIKEIVQKLKRQLGYDVDCEFTIEIESEGEVKINLVQCRPQNIPKNLKPSNRPTSIPQEQVVLEGEGSVNGTFCTNITDLIYVDPHIFELCNAQERRYVSSLVRAVNRRIESSPNRKYAIMPIRRWESADQNAGLNASFADFSNAAAIMEIFPDNTEYSPSFGSHSLQRTLDSQMATAAFKTGRDKMADNPLFSQAEQTLLTDVKQALVKEGCPPGIAEKLSGMIKIVDVDATWRKLHPDAKADRRFVAHLAQNNRTGKRPSSLYIAQADEHLPEIITT